MNFFDTLTTRAQSGNSLLCVGLDPRADSIASLREQCFRLIDATAEYALTFKPNCAFFEVWGAEGWDVLREVIAHVPAGIPVILDAKRGDIADTAQAYAQTVFDKLGAHAVTLSPYLGRDSVEPFIVNPEHGAFVLCKTSNPNADEFQALRVSNRTLYEIVAERVTTWNTRGNIGLVVGATDPESLARVRAIATDAWFLVPGIGAQGGDLARTMQAGLRADGLGLVINASRAIANASDPGLAAKKLRDEINQHRSSPIIAPSPVAQLARDLIATGCVRFGEFKLKSGITSPIYLDLRRLISHPIVLQRAARAYANVLRRDVAPFDRIADIPYAGLPIAVSVALEMNRPLIYARREAKEYGTRAMIEGDHATGERVVVLDDLATTGDTKIEAIEKLTSAGLIVQDIVVLIDREQGATEMLRASGYTLHAVTTLSQLLDEWRRSEAITAEQFDQVKTFLANTK